MDTPITEPLLEESNGWKALITKMEKTRKMQMEDTEEKASQKTSKG
jgi:hypothetical protein